MLEDFAGGDEKCGASAEMIKRNGGDVNAFVGRGYHNWRAVELAYDVIQTKHKVGRQY